MLPSSPGAPTPPTPPPPTPFELLHLQNTFYTSSFLCFGPITQGHLWPAVTLRWWLISSSRNIYPGCPVGSCLPPSPHPSSSYSSVCPAAVCLLVHTNTNTKTPFFTLDLPQIDLKQCVCCTNGCLRVLH